MEIVYVNYGIGNKIGDRIYINKALQDHPELLQKVMDHESKHVQGDKWIDFKEPFDWDIFNFFLNHPSAWCQVLPIWIMGRKIIYNKTMLIFWAFCFAWFIILAQVAVWIWSNR